MTKIEDEIESKNQNETEEKVEKSDKSALKLLKSGVALSLVSSALLLGVTGYALFKDKTTDANSSNQGASNVNMGGVTTPTPSNSVTISNDGYWVINGVETNIKAEATDGVNGENGKDGVDGKDGQTPHIGTNGNWWIGNTDTGVKAQGSAGTNGSNGTNGTNGVTPHIGTNGNWWIGTTDTGVKAEAQDGEDGNDGLSVKAATIEYRDRWKISYRIIFEMSDGTYVYTNTTTQVANNHYYEAASESEISALTTNYGVNKIKLSSDIEITEALELSKDTEFDLNGYTLTYKSTTPVLINNQSNVTFKNGNLDFNSSNTVNGSIKVSAAAKLLLDNVNYKSVGCNVDIRGLNTELVVKDSNLVGGVYCVATNANKPEHFGVKITLEDSSFKGTGYILDPIDYDNCPIMLNVPGTLYMKDCEVYGDRQAVIVRGGDAIIEDCKIVNSGKFSNKSLYLNKNWSSGSEVPMAAVVVGNRSSSAYEYNASCKLIDTEIVSKKLGVPQIYVYQNNDTYTATLEYDAMEYSNVVLGENVKTTVEVYDFESFENALQVLPQGGTIKLENDIDPNESLIIKSDAKDQIFTLDLNGYTFNDEVKLYSVDKTTHEKYNHVVDITIKNGEIGKTDDPSRYYGLSLFGSDNMNITLENVTSSGYYGGFSSNGNSWYSGATMTAVNSTFKAANGNADSLGAYLASDATYTFTNCTFVGADGIYIKNGDLTLNNCTVTATGAELEPAYHGSGAIVNGTALSVDSTYNYNANNDTMTVIINGGTFKSSNSYAIQEFSTAPADKTEVCYSNITVNGATLISPKNTATKTENGTLVIND